MLRIAMHSLLSVMVLALFTGCPGDETQTYNQAQQNVDEGGHEHGHSHEVEGPHGGHVIEIGEEAAHLEVTMGEDRTITLYVLGGDLKTALPVAVGDVIFELEGEGDEEIELELTATPAEGEADGTSSVFTVKADAVPAAVSDIEKLHGHVHITIDGKEYEGELEHDHGEDHDHDEDHDHEDGDDDHDHDDKDVTQEKDAE